MSKLFRNILLFCTRAFYEPNTRIFIIVNDLLSIIIIISIIAVVFESVSEFNQYHQFFLMIEFVAVFIFSAEYICRIIGAPKKLSYIFSLFGFIDLISILPTWLHITNLTPAKSVRALRIIRFLRIMRLAKITRLEHLERPSRKDIAAVIRLNLQIYFITIIFTVVILGNLAYIFEHDSSHFKNIPLSMLWILESLLGGSISTTVPQTYAGIIIFMVARFISLVLLGFLIHIIGNVISHVLLGRKSNRVDEDRL